MVERYELHLPGMDDQLTSMIHVVKAEVTVAVEDIVTEMVDVIVIEIVTEDDGMFYCCWVIFFVLKF